MSREGSRIIRSRHLPDGNNWKTSDIARLIYNAHEERWEIIRLTKLMAHSVDREELCKWGNEHFNLIEASYND